MIQLGCISKMWTEIWDDVRNPLSDVISDSVFARYSSLWVFWLAKTESEMTSLRGFLTSSQISVHILLLYPKCITESLKGYIMSGFKSKRTTLCVNEIKSINKEFYETVYLKRDCSSPSFEVDWIYHLRDWSSTTSWGTVTVYYFEGL